MLLVELLIGRGLQALNCREFGEPTLAVGIEQPSGSLLEEDVVVALPCQVDVVVSLPIPEASELRVAVASTSLPALLQQLHAVPGNEGLQTS